MNATAILSNSQANSNRIKFSFPSLPQNVGEISVELNELLRGGILSNFGKYVRALEQRLTSMLGVKHVRTVPNATTGLMLALSTLPAHSEVLVPSFTFPATAHALVRANLRPRFVEAMADTFNIAVAEAEAKITSRTSAILAVNVFGNPCQIDDLVCLAQKYKLKLFFDSAAAFGSYYKNQLLGACGDAEIFSMSGTKVLTAGEGGFIATNDEALAERLDCLRNYGYVADRSECPFVGFNGKLSELNAIIAHKSLDKLQANLARRRELAGLYRQHLNEINGLEFQKITPAGEVNYFTFALKIDPQKFGCSATEAQTHLDKNGIETKRYFFPPLHKSGAYAANAHEFLPNSEMLAESVLCLPMHSALKNEQVDRVCNALRDLHERSVRRLNGKHLSGPNSFRQNDAISKSFAPGFTEIAPSASTLAELQDKLI